MRELKDAKSERQEASSNRVTHLPTLVHMAPVIEIVQLGQSRLGSNCTASLLLLSALSGF